MQVVHHSPTTLDWLVNTRAHPLDHRKPPPTLAGQLPSPFVQASDIGGG